MRMFTRLFADLGETMTTMKPTETAPAFHVSAPARLYVALGDSRKKMPPHLRRALVADLSEAAEAAGLFDAALRKELDVVRGNLDVTARERAEAVATMGTATEALELAYEKAELLVATNDELKKKISEGVRAGICDDHVAGLEAALKVGVGPDGCAVCRTLSDQLQEIAELKEGLLEKTNDAGAWERKAKQLEGRVQQILTNNQELVDKLGRVELERDALRSEPK